MNFDKFVVLSRKIYILYINLHVQLEFYNSLEC